MLVEVIVEEDATEEILTDDDETALLGVEEGPGVLPLDDVG
jgi:hypothetical protein